MTPEQHVAQTVRRMLPTQKQSSFVGSITSVMGSPINEVVVSVGDLGPVQCRKWSTAMASVLPTGKGREVVVQFIDDQPVIICELGS